jgi:hypothetical protein
MYRGFKQVSRIGRQRLRYIAAYTVRQGCPTGGPRCHFMRPALSCLECDMFAWASAE